MRDEPDNEISARYQRPATVRILADNAMACVLDDDMTACILEDDAVVEPAE